MNNHAIASLILGTVFSFSIAHAGAGDVPTAATLKYADLDLDTPAGASALYRRLVHAAQSVCESFDPSVHSVRLAPIHEACQLQAVSEAVNTINRPQLNRLAASKIAPKFLRLAARRL